MGRKRGKKPSTNVSEVVAAASKMAEGDIYDQACRIIFAERFQRLEKRMEDTPDDERDNAISTMGVSTSIMGATSILSVYEPEEDEDGDD